MTEEQKKLFQEIIHRIVKGANPKSIYLFGSYARGEENENSDIDLLVEKETEKKFIQRCVEVRRLLRGLGMPFDILVYTPQELIEKKDDKYSVVYTALHNGVKLYGQN